MNQVVKKDLFAFPIKKPRKPYKKRDLKVAPSKADWWKDHGSWVELHNIIKMGDKQ